MLAPRRRRPRAILASRRGFGSRASSSRYSLDGRAPLAPRPRRPHAHRAARLDSSVILALRRRRPRAVLAFRAAASAAVLSSPYGLEGRALLAS